MYMPQDVITYLKKSNGNIRHIVPELEIINDSYRFDAKRFDILACKYSESRIYGIMDLRTRPDFSGMQRIVKDAEWIQKYKGAVITLMPIDDSTLHGIFDDEVRSGLVIQKYYAAEGKDYTFMDDWKDYESIHTSRIMDDASRVLINPQMVDLFLKQFEKQLPAIKFAREVYKIYSKITK